MKKIIILISGMVFEWTAAASYAQALAPLGPITYVKPLSAETTNRELLATRGPCSLKTLRGTYVFGYEGTMDSGATPVRQSGTEFFDGKGNVVGKFTTRKGNLPSKSMEFHSFNYTIRPDCTGYLSDASGPYADIFVDHTGSSFEYLFTNSSILISGETKRVAKRAMTLDR